MEVAVGAAEEVAMVVVMVEVTVEVPAVEVEVMMVVGKSEVVAAAWLVEGAGQRAVACLETVEARAKPEMLS